MTWNKGFEPLSLSALVPWHQHVFLFHQFHIFNLLLQFNTLFTNCQALLFLVSIKGFEPLRHKQQLLKLSCLPIPPYRRLICLYYITFFDNCQALLFFILFTHPYGYDVVCYQCLSARLYCNSRTHTGCDQWNQDRSIHTDISIHAPLRGATDYCS